jgi:GNAT superfamily N-acetyltransferase
MVLLSRHEALYYELTTSEGEIVGGVFVVNHWKYIEIVDLFVNKEFQGQGYGRSLLREVLNTYPYNTICLRCEAFGDGNLLMVRRSMKGMGGCTSHHVVFNPSSLFLLPSSLFLLPSSF